MPISRFLRQIFAIQELQEQMAAGAAPSPALLEEAGLGGLEHTYFKAHTPGKTEERRAAKPEQVSLAESLPGMLVPAS